MRFVCDKCKTKYTIADDKVRGKVLKVRCKTCANVIEVREPDEAPPAATPAPERPSTALKAMSRHAGTSARYRPPAGLATEAEVPRAAAGADRFPRRPPTGENLALRKPGGDPLARSLRGAEPAAEKAGRGALFQEEEDRAPLRKPAVPPAGAARGPGAIPRRAAAPAEDEPAGEKTQIAALPAEMLRRLQEPRPEPVDEAPSWYLGDERGEYGPMAFAELAARVQRGEPGPAAEAWREGFADWLPLTEIPELRPFVKVAPPPRPTQQSLPVSPFQKRPEAGSDALQAAHAPKSGAKGPETDELFHRGDRGPAAAGPARRDAAPAAVPRSGPAVLPHAVRPGPAPAVEPGPAPAGADLPLPALGTPPAADPFAASAVPLGGLGEAPAALAPLVLEEKRTRGKLLLLGGGVLLLLSVLIGIAVFWMATGRRNGTPRAPETHAAAPPEMTPEMAPEMAPEMPPDLAGDPAGAQELPELDIDVSPTMAAGGAATLRNGTPPAPRPREMTAPDLPRTATGTPVRDDPDTSPMFQALMGFGDPGRLGSSGSSSSGGRPKDLGSVVRRNYTSLKRCYEKAAMLDSRLKNVRLRVTVLVNSEGQVRSVAISPDKHQGDAVGTCVRRAIGTWKFPSYGNGYDYSFGANFIGS